MKKTLTTLAAIVVATTTFAAPYAWTGGGANVNSWNDSENWSPSGVPGGGDTATFSTAATITDGIDVSSGELKIVANGVAVTISGVISGGGALYFQLPNTDASKVVLSGANTYSGGTTVEADNRDTGNNPQTYGVWLQNATAFGTSRAVAHKGGTINLNCANAVFAYDFTPSTSTHVRYNAHSICTIDGFVASDAFAAAIFFTCKNSSSKLTVTGKVGGQRTTSVNIRSRSTSSTGIAEPLVFLGEIVANGKINPDTSGDNWSGGITAFGAPVRVTELVCAFNRYLMLADDVLCEDTVLNFNGFCNSDRGVNLNGTRQTVDRVKSDATSASSTCRHIYSTSDAVLTMRPSQNSLANMSAVNGAVSLVMDARNSSYVQLFSNRVSNTTGSLIASNGILRIGANASFANVPRLFVANNGAIEVTADAAAAALAGVREIVIEGSGRVSLPAAVLTAMAAAVVLDDTAVLEVTDGATLEVASLKIGSRIIGPGNHPSGSFTQILGATVSVPNNVSPDSTGVWTGAGETESSYDAGNWEGGYPGEIPVTFATGGTRALLDGSLAASELKFDTPQATPTFTVAASGEAPDALVFLSGDIVMTNAAHASGHTNVVSVPVTFSSTSAKIDINGAANGLVLDGPIRQQGDSLALTRSGSGALWLNATNAVWTAGSAQFIEGTTYLTGGALGGAPGAMVNVNVNPLESASGVKFNFCGGIHNSYFEFCRLGTKPHAVTFLPGTTNVFNGWFRAKNNNSLWFDFSAGSRTVFNGGVLELWENGYMLSSRLYGGAEVEIRESPMKVTALRPGSVCSYAFSRGTNKDARLVFAAKGNYANAVMCLAGPMRVVMDTDFAFNTNSAGKATPIALVKTPSSEYGDYLKPCIVDLNGHDQRFGSLMTVPITSPENDWMGSYGSSASSYFTSETPATLYVLQNGTTNAVSRPWPSLFNGAVSLVKEGTNTLALSGVSTTTGRLEVANGRLEFKDSGSMTNVSAFAVSGGVLAVDTNARLPRKVNCYLSGGKLDIAQGVRQRVRFLYVPDGAGGWRQMPCEDYTAASLPAYLSGGGVLSVHGDGRGMILVFQ